MWLFQRKFLGQREQNQNEEFLSAHFSFLFQGLNHRLNGFYRPHVFFNGNTHDIFLNINAKKRKKAKCIQSNDKPISAVGKSRLKAGVE